MFVFFPPAFLRLAADGGNASLPPAWQARHASLSSWLVAARWCLFGFGPADGPPQFDNQHNMPEVLLNEMRVRHALRFRLVPGCWYSSTTIKLKESGAEPYPPRNYVWHTHNVSAARAWMRTALPSRR